MNGNRAVVILLAMLIGVSAVVAVAQDTICDFTWYDNVSCSAHLDCIDDTWNGTSRTVPSNVTRIAEDGLKLCLGAMSSVSDADIIYIVDLSASMFTAGDPDRKRPQALAAGFDYQVANVPNSRAGYIGFSSAVITAGFTDPVSGSVAAGTHMLQPMVAGSSKLQFDAVVQMLLEHVTDTVTKELFEGTNYQVALDQAIAWFNDPALTPHANQAIVFFSDGNPYPTGGAASPTAAQVAFLEANGIPVYGIYMGDLTNCSPNPNQPCLQGAALKDLTDSTGGTYFEVDATRADTLAQVVRQIVGGITADFTLSALTVSNGTQTVHQHSASETDGVWSILTDGVLPLTPGVNSIALDADFTSAVGDTTIAFTFNLNVSGPSDEVCVRCRPVTRLEVLTVNNAPISSLSFLDNSYKIRLTYYGFDTLASVTVSLASQKGDAESMTLFRTSLAGAYPITFETTLGLTVSDAGAASVGNSSVETNNADQITHTWVHPADPRDSASLLVPVSTPKTGKPVATPPTTTYYGQVNVTLVSATSGAVIYYTLDGTDPGASPGANGQLYSGAIPIRSATPVTIQARAYRETMEASDMMVEVYTNGDPLGPVIKSVKYYLGNPPGASVPGNDTLVVTFDEPASCADLAQGAAAVFRYVAGPAADQSTVLAGSAINRCTGYSNQAVIILGTPGLVIPIRDSLAIRPDALSDSTGSRSVAVAPVVIRYGRDYDLIVSVSPNPVDFIQTDKSVFATLRSLLLNGDQLQAEVFSLVKVTSVDSVDISTEKSWMTVYDAVGNTVQDKVRAYRDIKDPQVVYFAWDLRSRSGRRVGTGTYLGVITIKLAGKGTRSRRQKIAVVTATGPR